MELVRKPIKGISFPFRFDTRGRVATSVADALDDTHIRESIRQIILTSLGERPMEPEFGCDLRRVVFQENNPSLDAIAIDILRRALERWEPRIEVSEITITREKYGRIDITVYYENVYAKQPEILVVELGGEVGG